jgi:outer membrane receptor protein involved in Fe transport
MPPALLLSFVQPTWAAERAEKMFDFDIPAEKLERAMQDLAIQSGKQLLFTPSDQTRRTGPQIKGRHTVDAALKRLLAKTSLTFRETDAGVILIVQRSPKAHVAGALSQPAVDMQAHLLPSVIVTGISLEDPVSMRGDVQRKPLASDVNDIAQTTLGMSTQPVGAGAQGMSMRGIGAAGDATTVVYFADVPIAGPTGTSGDASRTTSDLALIDIDRVEISRSAQGTLHGVGALAGEMEVHPARSALGRTEGFVSTALTAVEGGQPGYQVAAAANLPVGEDLAFRLTAYSRRTGGYVDNIRTGEDNVNDEVTHGVRAGIFYSPDSSFSLSGLALWQYRRMADTSAWMRGLGAYRTDRYFNAPTTHKFGLGSVKLRWQPDAIAITSISSYYRWNLLRNYDRTYTTQLQSNDPQACGRYFDVAEPASCDASQIDAFQNYAAQFTPTLLRIPISISRVMQEVRLDNGKGIGLRWLIGAFVDSRSEHSNSMMSSLAEAQQQEPEYFGWRRIAVDRSQYGVFGTVAYKETDGTTFSLGLRYDSYSVAAQNDVVVPNVISGSIQSWPWTRVKSSELLAKLHADIAVAPGIELHLQLARSARPAGVNTASVIPEGYITYEPDGLWGYEMGTKLSVLDDLQFTITGYINDWSDMQYRALSENRSHAYIVNIGSASIRGLEMELAAQPLPGLSARMEASFIDARLRGSNPNRRLVENGEAGDLIPFVPRWRTKGTVSYSFLLPGGYALRLAGEGQYQSGYWSTFNEDDQDFLETDGFFLLGASASLQMGNTTVTLTARNLLNEDAPIRAMSSGYGPGQTFSYGPRAATLAWKWNW